MRRELAVDVDLDARGQPRAVVGDGDVVHCSAGTSCCRLDADRVVQPALDEVDLDLASVEHDAVALALAARRPSARGWCPPRVPSGLIQARERELVVEAEPGDVAGVEERMAVEARWPIRSGRR